jgi:hypothetical protein
VIKGLLKQGMKPADIPASVDTYLKPKGGKDSAGAARANDPEEFSPAGKPMVMHGPDGEVKVENRATGEWQNIKDMKMNKENIQALKDAGFMDDQIVEMFHPGARDAALAKPPAPEPAEPGTTDESKWSRNRLGLNDEAHPKWEDMRSLEDIQEDAEMAKRDPNEGREWMGHPDPNVNEADMRQKLIEWFKKNGGNEPTGNEGPVPRKDAEEFNQGAMIMRKPEGGYLYENPFTGEWQSWEALWKGIHGEGDAGPAMRKK